MDKQQFFAQLESNATQGLKIMVGKNADYCGAIDPFKNFRAAEFIGMTVEQGILLRMMDKMARMGNLLQSEAKVKDESFEDTCLDLMNYANIMLVYRQSKADNKS